MIIESNPNHLYSLRYPDKSLDWAIKFFKEILSEIRLIICEKGTKSGLIDFSNYKSIPHAIGASTATVIMTKLEVSEPLAIGIATMALLTLCQATKNAFCNMTDAEVIEVLEKEGAEKK